ncbi:hypothetical protein KM043_005509 [Ampulex compressa]|nr:hypothetical protein KM043_005509 [Ampulex compressa]
MDGGATEIVGGETVPDLGNLERWWNDPGIAAWSFVLFSCFLLNATLLLAFLIRPGLRTISNRFVMNLTASNILTCAVLNPLLIMDTPSTSASASTSALAGSICAISEGATALVTTSSVLSVLLIAMDQYFAVVDPLRYRARVDKLKSGILIVTVWLISALFGLIAFFNPNPRSLWLSCIAADDVVFRNDSTPPDFVAESTLASFANETTDFVEVGEIPAILRTIESVKIDESIGLLENSTVIFSTLTHDSVTYGLIYAVVHSVFAYFLPFAGVCWIYVSIYAAAHRNSERTRRTGSRPILASASFCEEQYGPTRQVHGDTVEDFRRMPKISSLSSIDETSETTQPASQAPRRRSCSSDAGLPSVANDEQQASSGVVFTVGSQRVQVSPQRNCDPADENRANRVPIATLKAEFLEKSHEEGTTYEDFVRSKFRDRPDQRRKSSHDLMYEAMLARSNARDDWPSGEFSDGSSESENEDRFECFDTLEVPDRIRKSVNCQRGRKYFSSFYDYQAASIDDSTKLEESAEKSAEAAYKTSRTHEEAESLTSNGLLSSVEPTNDAIDERCKVDSDERIGKSILHRSVAEGRTSRRSSTTFAIPDVVYNITENSNSGASRVGKCATVNNTATEPSSCLLTPIVTITPAPNKIGTLQRVASIRSTSSYINSLKHRISNGSLFKYREETRAARISALVIVMGLICWSPYVILLVVKNLPQYSDQYLPHEYDVLALSFLILAAYVSPLLFGYRSRRVKRELRKFFCFKRELSYKNNRSLMAKKVLKRRHSSTLSHLEMDHKYNIFNCVYGRSRWPKEKVQFVQVPDTALAVETCRSSFSSGASTQISSTSTEEC